MKFRPCIDIHNGKVKQIVGGSLTDTSSKVEENYVSIKDAEFYAKMYKSDNVSGGHIILLNPPDSPYYDVTREQALLALEAYRGGLQVGGSINSDNAKYYLEVGASHVIVTSYVFKDGLINQDNLTRLYRVTGKDHLVLDLSCRKKDGKYYIVTDRWQKFTNVELNEKTFYDLSKYCDEFLIHAVDVEGKASGIEDELVELIGKLEGMNMTYAGGVCSIEDIEKIERLGNKKIDFTVGSALDLFGGSIPYSEMIKYK